MTDAKRVALSTRNARIAAANSQRFANALAANTGALGAAALGGGQVLDTRLGRTGTQNATFLQNTGIATGQISDVPAGYKKALRRIGAIRGSRRYRKAVGGAEAGTVSATIASGGYSGGAAGGGAPAQTYNQTPVVY
jgi:hypothetical protein